MLIPVPVVGLTVSTVQVCFPASIELCSIFTRKDFLISLSVVTAYRKPLFAERVKKGLLMVATLANAKVLLLISYKSVINLSVS